MAAVSESEIAEITNSLGPDDLHHLFHNLGIKPQDVEHAERSADTTDTKLKARAVLRSWKKQKGNDATLEILLEAKRKTLSEAKSTCSIEIVDETARSLRWWQSNVKEIYERKKRKLSFPGLHELIDSDDLFTEIKLEGYTNPFQSVNKLFDIKDSKERPISNILLVGRAGSGKSTLLSRLAYLWSTERRVSDSSSTSCKSATNNSNNQSIPNELSQILLSRFELILFLNVRKFKPGIGLIRTVKDQLVQSVPEKRIRELPDVINYLGTKCLFLIDGYDEISNETLKDPDQLLEDSVFSTSFIIISTRPHTLNVFKSRHGKCIEYADVLVTGFSESSKMLYIERFFSFTNSQQKSPKADSVHGLLGRIERFPVLKMLSSSPILLAMMCVLWREYGSIPYNLAGLYEKAATFLKHHFMDKSFCDQININHVVNELGRVAIDALFKGILQIRLDEFNCDTNVLNNGCTFGLISKESVVNGIEIYNYVEFFHKTFQEFCAASYWVSLVENNLDEFVKYLHKIHGDNIDEMEYLLRFACGIKTKDGGRGGQQIYDHIARLSSRVLTIGGSISQQNDTILQDYLRQSDRFSPSVLKVGGSISQKNYEIQPHSFRNSWLQRRQFPVSLGSVINPWRLPLILLTEMESIIPPKDLYQILNESNKQIFRCLGVHAWSDLELTAILDIHMKEYKENPRWLPLVREIYIFEHNHDVEVKIDTKAIHLVNLLTDLKEITSFPCSCTRSMAVIVSDLAVPIWYVNNPCETNILKLLRNDAKRNMRLHDLSYTEAISKFLESNLHTLENFYFEGQFDPEIFSKFVRRQRSLKVLELNMNSELINHNNWMVETHKVNSLDTLEELFICYGFISAHSLRQFLYQNKSLQTLTIRGCRELNDTNSIVEDHAPHNSASHSLTNVSFCRCSKNYVLWTSGIYMTNSLKNLDILEVHDMTEPNWNFLFIKLKKVAFELEKPTRASLQLQNLRLLHNTIGQAVVNLAELISFAKQLKMVDLRKSELHAGGMHELMEQLWNLACLEELYLDENNIGSGIETISSRFRPRFQNDVNLRQLFSAHLSSVSTHTNFTIPAMQCVHKLKLKVLHLRSCNLTENNCDMLTYLLGNAPYLTDLDLSGNEALGSSVYKIFNFRAHYPELSRLNLNEINITDKSIIRLPLHRLSGLTCLLLQSQKLGSRGFEALANSFIYLPKLKQLNIGMGSNETDIVEDHGRNISPTCVELLFKNVVHLGYLENLKLNICLPKKSSLKLPILSSTKDIWALEDDIPTYNQVCKNQQGLTDVFVGDLKVLYCVSLNKEQISQIRSSGHEGMEVSTVLPSSSSVYVC